MKKKILLTLMIFLSLLLASCTSKNMFTYVLDEDYDGYITMGTSADYPPYESIDSSGNHLTVVGIDVDIAKKIAHKLNKNLKIVNRNFDFLLEDLKEGKVDFVISGMNPTPERSQQVDFSKIYYEATHSVVIHKDNLDKYLTQEDLNKQTIKIGAQLGTTQADILKDQFSNAQEVLIADVNDLIMQLSSKNLDAVILETPVANNFVKNNQNLTETNYTLSESNDGEESGSAVAVKKGNSSLLATVNTVIDELISSGEINEIIDYHLNKDVVDSAKLFSFSNLKLLLQGLVMTIVLALLAIVFGSLIGVFITSLRMSDNKILSTISKFYVEIIRGTPLLVQVLLIYSFIKIPVILFLGIDLSSFVPGILALLINSSAYVSEIFRGGIDSVELGQTEAGLSLGMSEKSIKRKIVYPQAIKNIIPSLGNEFISLIKETSIFMYLGVAELMYSANIIKAETYQVKQVYIITALLYLTLTLTTSKIMSHYEKKLGEKYEK